MANQPCPCGKSSDAFEPYPNGGYCFSCSKKFFNNQVVEENKIEKSYQVIPYRGHSRQAIEKYGVVLEVENDTPIKVRYTYPSGWNKYRVLATKDFYSEGTVEPGLFGSDKFSAGCAKAITVTEGEEDALAVYELLGSKWPAVSIRGASSAKVDCSKAFEYLNSFERIYLCFDGDEPGRKAVQAVASLFPFNKVYVVEKTLFKDANDYLLHNARDDYYRVWHNARRLTPTNIISSFAEVERLLESPEKQNIATFPFQKLQDMTLGIRTGETYLFKAKEGMGKTEIFGAIEHHILKTTDVNMAILHLEDPDKRIVQRLAGYELKRPVHFSKEISNGEILEAYRQAVTRDHRVHIYESLENEDYDEVLNKLRFLVASCECRVVFLDHISRLVSGANIDDERRTLDQISTRLSQLSQELDFALLMVTHVNDDGLTRGSRNISKEAWTVIDLERDIESPVDDIRNTTKLSIIKNRFTGMTGPAGEIYFDPETFTLSDKKKELPV
jgi:twinkle protein